MNDREFITEMKRALIIAMRALIKRYHLSWMDFIPAEERPSTAPTEPAASGAGQGGV